MIDHLCVSHLFCLKVCLSADQTPEHGEKIAHEIREKLNVHENDLLTGAYMDMLKAN